MSRRENKKQIETVITGGRPFSRRQHKYQLHLWSVSIVTVGRGKHNHKRLVIYFLGDVMWGKPPYSGKTILSFWF
ncbi:MAG: hypothetical protein ACR2KZ_21065, partial [Segetibacter sp.]